MAMTLNKAYRITITYSIRPVTVSVPESGKRADPGDFDPVYLEMMPAERKRFKSIT